MGITFEVGGKYRNRKGEYEVLEMDGPRMLIRYADGQTRNTPIEMQARIRANMRAEKAFREAEAARRQRVKRTRRAKQGAQFTGLKDGDFQRGVTGTSWRARTSLGGLLAAQLSAKTKRTFESHAIYRRAEAHIVQPDQYNTKTRVRQAKFVFTLDPERALYGLYIEKNDGPMDASWRWPSLLAALGADEALQEKTLEAMRRLDLRWEVYHALDEGLWVQVTAGEGKQLQWQPVGGKAEEVSWPGFVEKLAAIDEDIWCNLYLCTHMDKELAILAGAGIAEAVVEVYHELLPLYEAATRSSDT